MENEYFNQRIDCHVKDCKYHDEEESHCTLGEITVSGKDQKKETFCDSFEEKKDE